jgi:methylase of polypeptide subunit release factors
MDADVILKHINNILLKEESGHINESAAELLSLLKNTLSSKEDIFNRPDQNYKFVIDDLTHIIDVQTSERKKYYLNRLIKAITEVRTTDINDINLNRWKEYDDIKTDSLWIISKRDRTGSHSGKYWGNFIPQIPNQLLRRYTKKGDWVLDPFSGSGTTLIECKRLGRNILGIDISPDAIKEAAEKLSKEQNNSDIITDLYNSDSLSFNYEEYLCSRGIQNFQFIILHPPYWDIIKFTEDDGDLSNCSTPENFLKLISEMTRMVTMYLEEGRHLALVIGDKYSKGEWLPLGFYAMQEILKCGLKLKSVIVKNFDETRGKMQQKELWRYRALAGGFYIFKHEYIFLFQKTKTRKPKEEE